MLNKIINKFKETMNIVDSKINGTRNYKKTLSKISPIENTINENEGLKDCTDIMTRPLYWGKGTLEDGLPVFLTNNNGALVGGVYEDMQNYDEQEYIKASLTNIEETGIEVKLTEELINDLKVYVFDYLQTNNAALHQVVYCKNNKAYVFSISEKEKISDANMSGFNSMLNMTLHHI